jgi:topoisomerase IA-like protein
LDEAIALIEEKQVANANRNINSFDYQWKKIEVLNWQYGAYIKYGGYNFRIPKWWKDATDLKLQDCVDIIEKKFWWAIKWWTEKEEKPSKKVKAEKSDDKPKKKPAAKKAKTK